MGIVKWFVKNPVAANLLMIIILAGGILGMFRVGKIANPPIMGPIVEVSLVYPGAGPEEVEERIIVRIEEAVYNIDGVKRLEARAVDSFGQVLIFAEEGYDLDKLLNEVKARVDAINTFPRTPERPQIRQLKGEQPVLRIAITGNFDERGLKEITRRVRDQISTVEGVNRIDLQGVRNYEVSIEISEFGLQKYGLSFDQVANAVKQSSVNMPAGRVDNEAGQIQIMTRGQSYVEEDFENIVVHKGADGTRVLLKDVATIKDDFEQNKYQLSMDGRRATSLRVIAGDNPDTVKLSRDVNKFLDDVVRPSLPEGTEVIVYNDNSESFASRLNMMLWNLISGLALVFIGLSLFLTPALAGWVCVGILVSFMGTFFMLPYLDMSLNMISLFSFILILGIVVDDAIIVGENVHRQNQKGFLGEEGAIKGATMIAKPVIFSAITTMIFFSPMMFVEGFIKQVVIYIPVVVILTLSFSLFESLLILPSHLRHGYSSVPGRLNRMVTAFFEFFGIRKIFAYLRGKAAAGLSYFVENFYLPSLYAVLKRKGMAIASFICAFMIFVSLQLGGIVGSAFMVNIPGDRIFVVVDYPMGAPYEDLVNAMTELEKSAELLKIDLEKEFPGEEIIHHIEASTNHGQAQAFVNLYLKPSEDRELTIGDIVSRWRAFEPYIPDAKNISWDEGGGSTRLNVRLSSADIAQLEEAKQEMRDKFSSYSSVFYVTDTGAAAESEAVLKLLPKGENLNLSLADLGRQVRQAFYGEEVQRIPRGADDVKVMVRLPESDRRSFDTLDQLRIRTPDGLEVPFNSVATVTYRPAPTQIIRNGRQRNVDVIGIIGEENKTDVANIVSDMRDGFFQEMEEKYPNVDVSFAGGQEEQDDFMQSLAINFIIGLFIVYCLMAVAFKSYSQPFIIMMAIPFGYMGSIVGHIVLGYDITIFSVLGIVAAAGVVVNDNLVLLDYINKLRERGQSVYDAVTYAAGERFRAIFLTSFTTFLGLVPLMLEQSAQAREMVPTVVSLAFGVLFATTVTLFLVPVLYLSIVGFKRRASNLFSKNNAVNQEASVGE
ncbi:efflux RND transporter permease subunit [Pseudemcibacter aquimaris]|uniref:efflux RND transporter permease subunit n=1 Tax=Pseudemcibacter aquimaris TaxID=2857064 RepID=UPI0020116CD3|nr:efflux RND transporter permease subunit [Pseudemcibacter aquimaris]MCC3860996.1 efflux RND transporter permease subunit [Pseudemcibacter aquimaris]WDU59814.1 efflux RND transporter permease subunit [Pseudemcibacter aquimaris]